MKKTFIFLVLPVFLAACAKAEATRTSANTMIIEAGAAPACGGQGAAKVAAKSAAIETIKAGYERYIINSGSAQNNVFATQMPGTVYHSGSFNRGGFAGQSTYVPGPTIVAGSHDRQLSVTMFKKGDPGFENALDARQQLGPDWEEQVKKGIINCL